LTGLTGLVSVLAYLQLAALSSLEIGRREMAGAIHSCSVLMLSI
jgi:hypothetical protein